MQVFLVGRPTASNYSIRFFMPYQETFIKGLWVFEPRLFEDNRGYFYESFNARDFAQATGFDLPFVQDNHSLSKFGVLRGLHFQRPPHQQSKLIRVIQGEVLDVAVDLRENSPTFKRYVALVLSSENKKQFFVPSGFAHGFLVLSPTAEVLYKCDRYYAPQSESGVIFDDPELKIDWQIPLDRLLVSEKDKKLPTVSQLTDFF